MDWSPYIAVWVGCALIAYMIASQRAASNAGTWGLVGLIFGPLGVLFAFANAGKGQAPAGIGTADELTKLAALRDAGTITPEEFDRQKALLLR